ncbi:OmpA family protein [Garicola koreensis]|uniref:Outer membrane protein OmpA-like peptidoglycan-associated protein n=1 Tax=Garicola koreensis TaxID=1262554 RepID=A0A7W5TND7_9MICC|nr:OmpA family protein [Garicola koreensis]MBB3666566.1 outer membrane protein OmpA-like peptidoglycan-associated protein [Garicola koreensis]
MTSTVDLWARAAATGAAALLLITACAPDDVGSDPSETQQSPGAVSEPSTDHETGSASADPQETELETDAQPRMAPDDDGFLRSTTLPEPVAEQVIELPVEGTEDQTATSKAQVISLDSDGEYARLVVAWLRKDGGEAVAPNVTSPFSARSMSRPFSRLVDRDAGELIEPLYAESYFFASDGPEDGAAGSPSPEVLSAGAGLNKSQIPCVCSSIGISGGDETTGLFYVDFPAPEADEVDLMLSEWSAPIREVPVTTDEPFELPDDEFSSFVPSDHEPAEQYGTGAVAERKLPLSARSESLTGVTKTLEGDTQEVSLPADVLFDFGESSLTSEAEQIIADAAEKLNEEASGKRVVIEGHTDNVDGHDINQPLSEDRAEAVTEAIGPMLDEGISIETEGHSFNQPLVPNEDADGNDLPQNRELNRRVSFRYTAVEDSGVEIDLGYEELEDLQEAEEVETAEGALASYVLPSPEQDRSEDEVRLDILTPDRQDESVMMRFELALNSGSGDTQALPGSQAAEDPQLFGKNAFSSGVHPGAGNFGLLDMGSEQQHFPVTGGSLHCLCSETLVYGPALSPLGTPIYAEFQLPEDTEGPLVLRIPDSAQIELSKDVVDHMTG